MNKAVDIISRKAETKTSLVSAGNLNISLQEPSVLVIHGSSADVARYERQGNDLLIVMKDGSVIRCNGYFIEDSEQHHGELVFQDDTGALTHVTFGEMDPNAPIVTMILEPTETLMADIQSLLYASSETDYSWGMLAGALLGGAGIGALASSGGSDKTHTEYVDRPVVEPEQVITATFIVQDKTGDKQGLLNHKDTTDETQPTFSGSGQPGATIQIKNESGQVIASAQVNVDGKWQVIIPTQPEGTHTYSVVQIIGDKTTSAGEITLEVVTANAGLSFSAISGDDVINATEHGAAAVISGQSHDLASGTPLVINLNGTPYQATVGENGQWTVTVPAVDVSKLMDSQYVVTVTGKDSAGNIITESHNIVVNTAAPVVVINTIGGDDILNAAEVGVNQTISGRVVNAEAGQQVVVSLNGKQYITTVNTDGTWSVSVPTEHLTGVANGTLSATASVINKAGNTGHSDRDVTFDAGLATININTVAGDDIINAIELKQPLIISGTSSDLPAGSVVAVHVNGKDYVASVTADGTWSIGIPANDVELFPAGSLVITASANDASGNPVSNTHNASVDLSAVAISIDAVTGDNVLNSQEKNQDLVLTGLTENVEAGQIVTITIGSYSYQVEVAVDGSWTATIPSADLAGMNDGINHISVSVSNVSGNSASSAQEVRVDTIAPTITIDTLAGDNILSADEATQALTISGTTVGAEAGQTVTVSLNGQDYITTVNADGSWSVSIPPDDLALLPEGNVAVTANVADKAGNQSSTGHDLLVDISAPTISINTVAGDDVINSTEHGQSHIISGTTDHAVVGDAISVVINGNTYNTTVNADGSWSVGVPASVISALQNGTVTITATVKDKAGNSSSVDHDILVNTAAPTLSIATLAGDDIINASEKGLSLTINGSSTGVAEGLTVTVSLNGKNYTAQVDSAGNWTLAVPAADVAKLGEANYTVSAQVTDAIGNATSATHDIAVNTAAPQVIINAIGGDDVLNNAEVGVAQTIGGRVVNAEQGQTVTVMLGGKAYTTTVNAGGTWSVSVPSDDLKALGDGELNVTASVTNKAGNEGSSEREIAIDAGLPGLRIDTVAGDDIINAIELGQPLVITGTSTDLAVGSVVTVTVNGKDYTASVTADGSWSLGIAANDVAAFPEGKLVITANASDSANNPVSQAHNVMVDLETVAISIDTVAGDNVLSAAEKGQDLVLTGSTQNVEQGQMVTVNVGGKNHQATVDASGHWTVTVPSADLKGLKEGINDIAVSVNNAAGNSASAAQEVRVDTSAPTIIINTLAGDDILNATEAGQPLTISGTTLGAEAGQTVTVTLNNQQYTTTVNANGNWTLNVEAADLANLAQGNTVVTAQVSDNAGNPSSTNHTILVDTLAPTVAINTVAGDDVINSTEHGQSHIISGTTTNAVSGDSITLTIGSNTYNTTVNADGSWSIGVPASVISALQNGTVTITATVMDKAGNSSSLDHDILVNTAAPTLSIATLAGDDIINASEKGLSLTINGSSTGVAEGLTVTVSLNGKNYTAQVDSAGNWTLAVPAADVAKLGEANYTVSAQVVDAIGNATSATHDIAVNTAAPQVIINVIGGDDILNADEVSDSQTIGGQVINAEEGQTVTVTLGGKAYTTTVNAGGSWSVSVPSDDLKALGDGGLNVTASVTNKAGNEGSGEREIAIDAGLPGLRIDTVAGDDIINAIELGQPLVITGTSTDLAVGSVVTVTVNGKDYTASVTADGSWSLGIAANDVAAFPEGKLVITANASDSANNPVSQAHNVVVDLDTVAISIDTVAGDNVLSGAEKGQDLVLSGSTQNVEQGQMVTVNVGGKSHQATVDASGHWTITVPSADLKGLKEGINDIAVSVNNTAGNSASAAQEVRVDTSAPTITINTLAGDDILNATEAGQPLTISGTTVGAEVGQTVTVTLNNQQYTTTVNANGNWTLNVEAADLAGLAQGNAVVTAQVSDNAGNPSSTNHTILVDTLAPTVAMNTVAGDDVINSTEHGQSHIISGTTTNAVTGDSITLTIGSNTYNTTVNADGSWSVGVPASVISGLQNGTVTITATVTDKAGNSSSLDHDILVNTAAPTLSIATLAGDDIINASEKGLSLTINGSSTGVAEGLTVTVSLNGKNYTAQVDSAGNWTLAVPAADVAKLGEANYIVSAQVADAIGNTTSATHDIAVNTVAPQVIINAIGGDDVLNNAEVGVAQTIGGRVINAEEGQTVTVTLGGKAYTTTVNAGGTWSVSVPSDDLKALGDGGLNVTASVTNKAGNEGSGEREIAIDAGLPGLRIDTVAGDDIINAIELGQSLVITGTSTDLAVGSVVTVMVNGKDYTASVTADGSWSLGISATDVAAFPEGKLVLTANAVDGAGNPATNVHNVTVDLAPVAISINTVAGDNVLSAVEKGQDLVLTGSTQNVEEGQVVTVNIGGKHHLATVDSEGNWAVTVSSTDLNGLNDGINDISVSVNNAAGNSASAAQEVRVDTLAPTITINALAGDNILNATEIGQPLTVSGTTIGAEVGQTVTVLFNGKDYTTTVDTNGSWTLNIDASDLAALVNGNVVVTAKVSDKAGNESSAIHNVLVDMSAPTITIGTVAGDDVINSTEHSQPQIISGTTNALVGDSIVVTIDSNTYNTTVNVDGSWSVGVPANVISALQNGTVTITASVTDKAGNSSSVDHNVVVNTTAPTLAINTLAGDDIINSTEKGLSLTISGTSTGVAEGLMVTVVLNGKTYTALVAGDGSWAFNVPAKDVAALGEASYTVNASVADSVGNSVSANHNVVVDTRLPGVTIDTVASDNIINATEIQSAQTISGKVYNVEVGQSVTLTINGETYQTTVQAGGKWSLSVPADDWQTMGNGNVVITVEVTNLAGNRGQAAHHVVIDANLPGISIGTISGDDVINIIEHDQNLIIKGSSEGFDIGSILKVTVNGITYDAAVGSDGNWLVDVPAIDVSNFPAGTLSVTAKGQNSIGESVSNSHLVNVDLVSTAITIDTVADDDMINAAEKGQALTLSGSVIGIEIGQLVTLVIGGMTYTTTVQGGGTWTYTLSANAVSKLAEGNLDITVNAENQSGNSASAGRQVVVNSQVPAINIDTISGDDLINSAEHTQMLTISGTSYGLETGREVTVMINGLNYTALVAKDGSWTLDIPANVVSGLADGSYQILASASNVAGNGASASHNVTVDTIAPSVAIDNVTNDNMLNAEEHSNNQVISGTSNAIGQTIYVTIGGETYSTEVRKDGTWIVGVPSSVINSLTEGTNTVEVSVMDKAGNSTTTSKDFEVVAGVSTLSINTIAGDNVLNQQEHNGSLEISGTASSNLIGRDVIVTLNGKNYTAIVSGTGTWTITVDAADVVDLSENFYRVTASATDISGNAANISRDLTLDLVPPSLAVSDIAIDNVVNAIEHGKAVVIKGSYGGAENGQLVTVTLNGNDYTVAVIGNGTWSITVPAGDVQNLVDGDYNVKVSLSDKAGNKVSVDKSLVVDTTAPEITIAAVTGDDSISATEQAAGVVINGTTTAEAGQTVNVNFNGRNYSVTVGLDNTWTINVPSNHFNGIVDGTYPVTVSVSDDAGNGTSISHNIAIVSKLPTLTIDTFAIDNVVNREEHGLPHQITGTSDAIGQTVTVMLNGQTYTARVSDSGTWVVNVSTADMLALAEGSAKITAEVKSSTGNTISAEHQIEVDLTPPAAVISIDSVSDDTGLKPNDFITSDNTLTLSGTLNGALGAGEEAQLSIDGGNTWVKLTIAQDGKWNYVDSRTLIDGTYNYQVRVIDRAGNVGSTSNQTVVVDTKVPDNSIVAKIDSISSDTGLNNSDFITSDNSLTLTGSVVGTLGMGEEVQISLDGGKTWIDVNRVGNSWTYQDGRTLADGQYTYYVRVVDAAGNVGQITNQVVTVDTVAPAASKTIKIDGINSDTGLDSHDFITSDNTLTINGTLGAVLAKGEYVQISLDGGATWITVSSITGIAWSYTDARTLADGNYTYMVRVVDDAGNVGQTAQQIVTVDTVAPSSVISIGSISDDSGVSNSDFITNDNTLTLNGSLSKALAAGELAQISLDGGKTWISVSVSGLTWSYLDARVLTDGTHNYQVRVVDTAGNVGSSVTQVVTVDTLAPVSIPTIIKYHDDSGERIGDFGSGTITDDTNPVFMGSLTNPLADGEIIQVYRNGILVGSGTMTGATTWTFTDSGLLNGSYSYIAKVVDKAGNMTSSSGFDLVVDTTIPTTTALINPQTTADITPVISGSIDGALESGQYVKVVINGKVYTSEGANGAVVVDPLNHTWYVQIPDTDLLGIKTYDVTAQVMSGAGNGNNATISHNNLIVTSNVDVTPTWTLGTGNIRNRGAAFTLDDDGMWMFGANQKIAQSTSRTDYAVSSYNIYAGYQTNGSFADINRDGNADYLGASSNWDTVTLLMNNNGTFTSSNLSRDGRASWYGSVVAFDREGDGYIDFYVGDAGGPDSNLYYNNNAGTLVPKGAGAGTVTVGNVVGSYSALMEGSGVDLNNDGKIDLVQHISSGDNYALATLVNQGDGTFVWGQKMANAFYASYGEAQANNVVSMTWADFNGDGYMDLYMGMSRATGTQGTVMLNDKNGNLLTGQGIGAAATDKYISNISVATDWNHDGKMDIIKLAAAGNAQSYLYTNDGLSSGLSFTTSAFGSKVASAPSGAALVDYDWDGAQDLLIFSQNGAVTLERNTNKVESGTSIHLKIVDKEGINVFYGNTVRLYDSSGKLVASQVINAQSGVGVNDSSSLVSFYGLNPNETYHAELVNTVKNVSSNIGESVNQSWGNLTAQEATHNYVLSAEGGADVHNAKFVGTGYNDTFFATAGTDTYNGGGGWESNSQHNTWKADGGRDIVDFKLSTVGIEADLSLTTAQNTKFNISTFNNIEGIAGSNFDDVIKGNSGNNEFEGRGGNDTFNIGQGGHDSLLYKLLNAADATGGNGHDMVNGFTLGTWEGTADTDRIDIRELLQGSGYTGTADASYVNGVATLGYGAGNIMDYINVRVENGSTIISVDRDGGGGNFASTDIVTISGTQTDLATLLANHQLLVV